MNLYRQLCASWFCLCGRHRLIQVPVTLHIESVLHSTLLKNIHIALKRFKRRKTPKILQAGEWLVSKDWDRIGRTRLRNGATQVLGPWYLLLSQRSHCKKVGCLRWYSWVLCAPKNGHRAGPEVGYDGWLTSPPDSASTSQQEDTPLQERGIPWACWLVWESHALPDNHGHDHGFAGLCTLRY